MRSELSEVRDRFSSLMAQIDDALTLSEKWYAVSAFEEEAKLAYELFDWSTDDSLSKHAKSLLSTFFRSLKLSLGIRQSGDIIGLTGDIPVGKTLERAARESRLAGLVSFYRRLAQCQTPEFMFRRLYSLEAPVDDGSTRISRRIESLIFNLAYGNGKQK